MIIFISGLPGAGKSTVGSLVAKELGWTFVEADAFLSEEMKVQIKKGKLLSVKQLDAWVIEGLIPNIIKLEQEGPIVAAGMLAELKYIKLLSNQSVNILYINLDVPYATLQERVTSRDHFAKEKMLNECWKSRDKLILPGPSVCGDQPLDNIVEAIIKIAKTHFSV